MIKLLLMNMVSSVRFYSSYVFLDGSNNSHFIYLYIYIFLGLIRQPKWGHLKELHAAIKFCSATLLQGVRTNFSLGQHQEVMSQSFMISHKVNLQRLYMVSVSYLLIFT